LLRSFRAHRANDILSAARDLRSTVWVRTVAGGRDSKTDGATFSRQPASNDAVNKTATLAVLF